MVRHDARQARRSGPAGFGIKPLYHTAASGLVHKADYSRDRLSREGRNRSTRAVPGKVAWDEALFPPAGQAATEICAAFSVLLSSMAMVMGPTPPGTGVMASAFSATDS